MITLLYGSLSNASELFRQKIARTMQDCSDFELRAIADMVRSLTNMPRRWQERRPSHVPVFMV